MRKPTVLAAEQTSAELRRLTAELRGARISAGLSSRAAAQAAGCNVGTVWRIEQGKVEPTFLRFVSLAMAVGARLETDDAEERSRVLPPDRIYLPPHYDPWHPGLGREAKPANFNEAAHWERVQIGAELWWARWVEMAKPLHDGAMCRTTGISRHTLTAIEVGPRMPDLASLVRVAAVTGRRLVLHDAGANLRERPWAS